MVTGLSPVVLYLCSPIPITFENPQQLQSYPRLGMHLSSWSCHVFTPIVRLGSARCGSGSCRGVHSLSLCRVRMPFPGIAEHRQPEPCPLAPEVARVICEVLASSPPRGVPENWSFLSDFHLARLLLLLRKCAACDPFFISPRRGYNIIPLLAGLLSPRCEGLLQPSDRLLPLLAAARGLLVLLHPRAACACCHISHSLQSCRHLLAQLCSCVFWQAVVLPVRQDAPDHRPDLFEVLDC